MYEMVLEIRGFNMDDSNHHDLVVSLPFGAWPSESSGKVALDIEIDAPTPAEAVVEVIEALKRTPFTVRRIDIGLVTVTEIAKTVGVDRESVRLWATGQRRRAFPTHYTVVSGSRVWTWADVYQWLVDEGVAGGWRDAPKPIPTVVAERFNGVLAKDLGREGHGWNRLQRQPVVSLKRLPSRAIRPTWSNEFRISDSKLRDGHLSGALK